MTILHLSRTYAVCLASLALLTAGCGAATERTAESAGAASGKPSVSASGVPTPTRVATPTPPPTPSPTPTPSIDPGSLPQTEDKPSAADPAFQARMAVLWQAIATNTPTTAHETFFPLTAYRQIKPVNDPDGDYRDRLLGPFDLDLTAAHQRVGADATFVRVDVPDTAQWMKPGTEYNKGPYWRVLGARVVYRTAAGAEQSLGIQSMISWRGQWYLIHLGPFNRPAGTGAVLP